MPHRWRASFQNPVLPVLSIPQSDTASLGREKTDDRLNPGNSYLPQRYDKD